MPNILSTLETWLRGLTTNHARLDPQSNDPLMRPLAIPCDPGDVADAIQSWAAEQPEWSNESRQEEDCFTTVLHLTRRTKLMRFTDDIYVRLFLDGDLTHVDAESQSRLGKGDFGQNRRNLRELVGGLSQPRSQNV